MVKFMKPRNEYKVEKLLPGGLGLARDEKGVILLAGVLPGEIVLAEDEGQTAGARRGRLLAVVRASPHRVDPDCPLACECGGCDFIHADPAEAPALKSEAGLGALARRLGLEPELVRSPLTGHYRPRAALHLGREADGAPALGFFNARRRIVEFSDCRLLAPGLLRLLPPLRAWAGRHANLLPGDRADFLEVWLMTDLDERKSSICLSPPPGRSQGRSRRPARALARGLMEALKELRGDLDEQGLDCSVHARISPDKPFRRLDPGAAERLAVAGWPQWNLTLTAAPGGFTQVNPAVNKLMVKEILAEAAPLAARARARALDLYAGLGNISLPLLKTGFEVTAVEQSPLGAEAARANGLGLKGLTVINDRSEKAVESLARQGFKFDLIVLDPPRSGAGAIIPGLSALGAQKIIYIACHPAVLERDLPTLASLGYAPRRLLSLDMFPRTTHLEAMAVMERS